MGRTTTSRSRLMLWSVACLVLAMASLLFPLAARAQDATTPPAAAGPEIDLSRYVPSWAQQKLLGILPQ